MSGDFYSDKYGKPLSVTGDYLREPMPNHHRFTIKFEGGAYYVDIPNYSGGEVVDAAFVEVLLKALARADRLCKEALPQFDWGKSILDANAIALLNEVPGEVAKALALQPEEVGSTGQEFTNMLWRWLEDRGFDLRSDLADGLTVDDFSIMLDEHEADIRERARRDAEGRIET